jgi:hypothetical protein
MPEVLMSTSDSDKAVRGSIPELYETYLVSLIFEPYAANPAASWRVPRWQACWSSLPAPA